MKIKLIDNSNDFAKMEKIWNIRLVNSYANLPFLTFEWLFSWYNYYGKSSKLYILALEDEKNKSIDAIAPFIITKYTNFRIIRFLGTGISDYLDFIIEGKVNEKMKSIFLFLNSKRKHWDLIYLRDVLLNHDNLFEIANAARAVGWDVCIRRYDISPYISINKSWNEFLSSRSANFRYTIRKKLRRIKKEGLKFQAKCMKTFNNQVFQEIVEIEKRSWKFKAGTAKIQNKDDRNFYHAFFKSFSEKGWLNIWIGYLNNNPSAYIINIDYKNKIWFYNSAYDENTKAYSLGSILMYMAVKDAFFRKKTEYNFLRGDEEHKKRWTNEKYDSYQIIIFRKSLPSVLGYFLLFRFRWYFSRYRKPKIIYKILKRIFP